MKDKKHIQSFNEHKENLNISDVIDSIFSLLEDRFNELQETKKKYKDKWNYYGLERHRAKEQELSLLYRRIKEKFPIT